MKKLITTLLILSGICSAAFAQMKNTTEFGVSIGYSTSNVEYSGNGQSSDYTDGFNAAVSLEHYFSEAWSIKGRLIYDQKGFGNGYLTFDDGTEVDGVNFHLNYLTIPVMASWHFGSMRNWYLHFGPYVGILLNANESAAGSDVKNYFNTTDVGIDLGLGVKFPINNRMNLFIEGDGQGGFTNIFKGNNGDSFQNVRSSVNIGLSFPLR